MIYALPFFIGALILLALYIFVFEYPAYRRATKDKRPGDILDHLKRERL